MGGHLSTLHKLFLLLRLLELFLLAVIPNSARDLGFFGDRHGADSLLIGKLSLRIRKNLEPSWENPVTRRTAPPS